MLSLSMTLSTSMLLLTRPKNISGLRALACWGAGNHTKNYGFGKNLITDIIIIIIVISISIIIYGDKSFDTIKRLLALILVS